MSEEAAYTTSDDEVETGAPVAERNATPHLAALGEKARDYARNARAENTQRAYDADWRQFSSWLRRQGFDRPAPESANRRAVSRRLRRRRARKGAYFRRDAGAAALGDLLALSPARRTAGHERSAHLDRARRHPPRPWPTARPERSDLRRRTARDAGHARQRFEGPARQGDLGDRLRRRPAPLGNRRSRLRPEPIRGRDRLDRDLRSRRGCRPPA